MDDKSLQIALIHTSTTIVLTLGKTERDGISIDAKAKEVFEVACTFLVRALSQTGEPTL